MTNCPICKEPLGRATHGTERPRIVCGKCHKTNETKARAAEDRYFEALRVYFEDATSVWAANTLEREA